MSNREVDYNKYKISFIGYTKGKITTWHVAKTITKYRIGMIISWNIFELYEKAVSISRSGQFHLVATTYYTYIHETFV